TSGDLYMWGNNFDGRLGDGTDEDRYSPTLMMGDVARVSSYYGSTAAVTTSGDLYIWGDNYHGQLGDGTTEDRYSPTLVMGDVAWVTQGCDYTAAVTTSGDLYMWGSNDRGELGDGTTEDRYAPAWIAGPNSSGGGQGTPFRRGVKSLAFSAKGRGSTDVEWDDDWFMRSSYDGEDHGYNHDLAIVAAVLSSAAYRSNLLSYDYGQLGFDFWDSHYNVDFSETDDRVAYGFALKELEDGAPLIAVTIRGTVHNKEWASNFNIDNDERVGGPYHDGFESAARELLGSLESYCDAHDVDYTKARFLITGHSRGAAVANLVATFLDDDVFRAGVSGENVYAYTFACPPAVRGGGLGSERQYLNIWNIINPEDLVPRVPLSRWGYGRNGVDRYLPSVSTSGYYPAEYDRMNGLFRVYYGEDYANYPGGVQVADSVDHDLWKLAETVEEAYDLGPNDSLPLLETLQALLSSGGGDPGALFNVYVGVLRAYLSRVLVPHNELGNRLRLFTAFISSDVYRSFSCDLLGGLDVFNLLSGHEVSEVASLKTEATHAHTTETYISWMQSSEDGSDILQWFTFRRFKYRTSASGGGGGGTWGAGDGGPLHTQASEAARLEVIDASGNTVCIVADGEVQRLDGPVPAISVEDGVVTVDVPDGDSYQVRCCGDGDLSISASDLGVDGSVGQVVSYQEVELADGACTTMVPGGSGVDGLEVEQEGAAIEPSHVSTSADDTVQVTLEAGEGGDAWGGGEVRLGDIVTVHALPADDGHYFAGWYAGEELVSAEPDHAVLAASDVSLRAEFAPRTSVADDVVSVEVADGSVYSGGAVEPAVRVTHGDVILAQGVDYDLSFSGNVDAGDAVVTIEGIGRYMGTRDVTFQIAKSAQTITASNKTVAMGKTASLGAKASGEGKITYKSSNTAVAKVSATGVVTPVKVGTAEVTISVTGDANHEPAAKTVTVTVTKGTQSITASNKTVAVGGTVSLGAKASGGGKLTYRSSNTKVATVDSKGVVTGKGVGTATITVATAATPNYNAATRKVTVTVTAAPSVSYRTHVQNVGWQAYVKDGAMSGTSGRALRLEGINIKLTSKPVSGGITYRTHVQNIGWQGWKKDGAMSGTSGKALRLEAIQIKLTGKMAEKYDVYYRVHCQNIGWMGWAKNGQSAGSAGYAYRLEGIQVVIVPKGAKAPSTTYKCISANTSQAFRQK
ncbi:MAG: hypothetical protein IKE22_11890, partial [Atopobiaceae bacterium]|nr:hypothetical protein [Atopobiaceae bacterium]